MLVKVSYKVVASKASSSLVCSTILLLYTAASSAIGLNPISLRETRGEEDGCQVSGDALGVYVWPDQHSGNDIRT